MTEEQTDLLAMIARGDLAALTGALDAGGDADARDRWDVPAISHAAARGDLAAVRLLLKHGADPRLTSSAGNSPLMVAAACGQVEIVRVLLDAGADPSAKNKWDLGASDWAEWSKNPGEMRALLAAKSAHT